MKKLISNIRGSTIIEGLVALGILASVFMSLLSAFTNIFTIEMTTGQIVNEQQVLAMIIESIKAEPTAYVKDFSKKDPTDILTPDKLPLGFNKNYFGPKEDCGAGGCEAYIGYVLQPVDGFSGLFRGTIMVYKPKVSTTPSGSPPQADSTDQSPKKIYSFLINSN